MAADDKPRIWVGTFDSREPGDVAAFKRHIEQHGLPLIAVDHTADLQGYKVAFPSIGIMAELSEPQVDVIINTLREAKVYRRRRLAEEVEKQAAVAVEKARDDVAEAEAELERLKREDEEEFGGG